MVAVADSVYVGGIFQSATNAAVGGLGKWNGTNWSAADASLTSSSSQMLLWGLAASPDGLYAIAAENGVMKWDGTNWVTLGYAGSPGLLSYRPQVYTLLANGSNLLAGGMFNSMSGCPANGVAKWDGSGWSPLGVGVGRTEYPPYVTALAAGSNMLYVGGAFTAAGDIAANGIAAWDGANWTPLSTGVFQPYPYAGGVINALALMGCDLYAGGVFISAGGVNATNIAKWDGTNWTPLAGGLDGAASSMVVNGRDLYVGGSFSHAGAVPARNLAKWDGTNWAALGSGAGGAGEAVCVLAANGSELFVGGSFASAGAKPSYNFAIWHIPDSLSISRAGHDVRLSWPAAGRCLSLETSVNLADWHAVDEPVTLDGTECVVTNSSLGITRFYRLRP